MSDPMTLLLTMGPFTLMALCFWLLGGRWPGAGA